MMLLEGAGFRNILDPNWIATMLSVVFTLFIFLLSIPILFFQTFLPEDIREIYNKGAHKEERKKELRLFWHLLLVCLFIFGNHAIVFFIDKEIEDGQPVKSVIFVGYYLLVLVFFFVFSLRSYKYFLKSVFREKNIRKEVIEQLVTAGRQHYDAQGTLDEALVNDLAELSKSFSHGYNKSILFYQLDGLIRHVIHHPVHPYNGDKLADLVQLVHTSNLPNDDEYSEKNLNQILTGCRHVANKYRQQTLQEFDSDSVIKCLSTVAGIAIKKDYVVLLKSCLDSLHSLPASQDDLYHICKSSFAQLRYMILFSEIHFLIPRIAGEPAPKTSGYAANLIAYLAWLYGSPNRHARLFALRMLRGRVRQITVFTAADLRLISKQFYMVAEYETSAAVSRLSRLL